ncbi:hypothetical protein MKW94_007114 [Papaver nudicaule]|uniref:Uncharacterized protein n=1 Tax=Papaver nudicaule TaxID=74823 RepID=A0AA41V0J1_PAPNU|nr:hypothetical protein [Papaver nudicaule]
MNLCGRPESDDANCDVIETGFDESCIMVDVDQSATPHSLIPNTVGASSTRGPTSLALPGILKARV